MKSFSWEKLSNKEKISVFAIVVIFCAYLLYKFVLESQYDHINDLTAQYANEQHKVKVIEDFLVVHPNPEQYLLELDNKIVQVNNLFPDTPEISGLLGQFEQLSRDCGVQLNYLKPTKSTNNAQGAYRELEIELSIKGPFADSMNFLNKLEHGSRFVNVSSIAMELHKNVLESKITVKVYSYGVPAAASQIAVTPPKAAADTKTTPAPAGAPPIANTNATK